MDKVAIEQRLRQDFPDAQLQIVDLTGSGDHWRIDISSARFAGLNLIAQHKLVYQALNEFMPAAIHALQLNTTPLQTASKD